jgi:2-polyprenyl-3-methyl-5-hydroxy-6-metoxy-1,4-benzoquinol methylase
MGGKWSEQHERERLRAVVARNFTQGMGYDPNLSDALVPIFGKDRLAAKNLLSVGCGVCLYERDLAKRAGIHVVGVEPNLPEDCWPEGVTVHRDVDVLDNATNDKTIENAVFDVVANIEVAEHIPREMHTQWFDWLVKHVGKYMIFSAAHVGQGGCGHVAESPEEYWREHLTTRGLVQDMKLTEEVRGIVKDANFRMNMMIFKRP